MYETNITTPKKQLEFYKDLSEQLQQENQELQKQLEYLRSGEYLNQLKFERNMLQDVVDKMEVSKEDKDFIDMTHRNTELLEENEELSRIVANKVISNYDIDTPLKKQLNEERLKIIVLKDLINEYQNQQKEFIELLEKEIVDSRTGSGQQYYAQQHLKLYKEAIGVKDE